MLPELHNYVLAHWNQLPQAGPKPKNLTFLGQATGVSKACFFLFADDEPSPRYIVKIPRSPAYNDGLMQEVSTIQRLRTTLPENLRVTLPGPMHVVQLSGHRVVIEPVLAGQPMDSLISSDGLLDQPMTAARIALAHKWLVEIQLAAPHQKGKLDAATIDQYFLEPLGILRSSADLTKSEEKYVNKLIHDVRALDNIEVPLYLYHGDFRAGNILIDHSRISVLDWQFSRPLAPPLLDWFSFVFRYYSGSVQLPDIDGSLEAYRGAFHHVFFSSNWFSELVADYTRAYCKAVCLDDANLPLLFSLFVVNSINHFHAFLCERASRGYLYLLRGASTSSQSWRQQVRRQAYVWLFGDIVANPIPWSAQ